jgi:DNA end-binding protein Ku
MHNREYTVFLRPMNNGLMLHTMYYENEVRQVDQFGKTSGIELKDAEVKVAHQLVEALAADFDPKKYSDTFEENVKKLIQARLEGKEVAAVEKPRRLAPAVDLMAALKESLAQVPKKPAQRVGEAQRASEATTTQRKSARN